jgi:hypothetical protein
MCIHEALLTAVQEQPVVDVALTVPEPLLEAND